MKLAYNFSVACMRAMEEAAKHNLKGVSLLEVAKAVDRELRITTPSGYSEQDVETVIRLALRALREKIRFTGFDDIEVD